MVTLSMVLISSHDSSSCFILFFSLLYAQTTNNFRKLYAILSIHILFNVRKWRERGNCTKMVGGYEKRREFFSVILDSLLETIFKIKEKVIWKTWDIHQGKNTCFHIYLILSCTFVVCCMSSHQLLVLTRLSSKCH